MPAHPVRFLAESKDSSRALLDTNTGREIFWWRGVDLSLQVALSDYGKFLLASDIGTIAVEIKRLTALAMDPNLVRKEFAAENCDETFTSDDWSGGAKALLTAEITADEIPLAPGRYRLIVSHEKDGVKNTYASTVVRIEDSQSGYNGVDPPPAPGWWLPQYAPIGTITLPAPPVSTITGLEIIGGPFGGRTLVPATPSNPDFPNQDTSGRQPFTPDGTWDEGVLYDLKFFFDITEWLLTGEVEPGTTDTYHSGSKDMSLVNANAWPWVAGIGQSWAPKFAFTYETEAPGVAGQQYRVNVEGGLFEIYEKQGDNSIVIIGTYDAAGNQYTLDYRTRNFTEDQWETDAPEPYELITIGDTGCTAVGDGEKPVNELFWQGNRTFEITSASFGESGMLFLPEATNLTLKVVEDIVYAGDPFPIQEGPKTEGSTVTIFVDAEQTSPVNVNSGGTGFWGVEGESLGGSTALMSTEGAFLIYRRLPDRRVIVLAAKDVTYS